MIRRACVAVVLGACLACGGGDQRETGSDPAGKQASDTRLYAGVRAKLESCGILASDAPSLGSPEDALDRCYGRCTLDAACEDIAASGCEERDTPFSACLKKCPTAPEDGFACRDGQRIPHLALCDGEEDCRQGEDELDCVLACADGSDVPGVALECDGTKDCADGSDEEGCWTCPHPEG